MNMKTLFLLMLFVSYSRSDLDPEWTDKFPCGPGLSCIGLDPPADGCYYNSDIQKGLCFHNVDGMGYVFFKGRAKQVSANTWDNTENTRLRMMQTSGCIKALCNTCVKSCYDPYCTDPASCSWCTCFSSSWYSSYLSQPNCCPLPPPGIGLE